MKPQAHSQAATVPETYMPRPSLAREVRPDPYTIAAGLRLRAAKELLFVATYRVGGICVAAALGLCLWQPCL
jgi:hypothetical protein